MSPELIGILAVGGGLALLIALTQRSQRTEARAMREGQAQVRERLARLEAAVEQARTALARLDHRLDAVRPAAPGDGPPADRAVPPS